MKTPTRRFPSYLVILLGLITGISIPINGQTAFGSEGKVVGWSSRYIDPVYITNVAARLTNVIAVAANYRHAMALMADGTVVDWGQYGAEGAPTFTDYHAVNAIKIAAGYFHGLAIRSDGTVVAWGNNYEGQTDVPPGLKDVIEVAGGYSQSLALRSDGTVVEWGTTLPGATLPPDLTNIISIACANRRSFAVKADGTVVTWPRTNATVSSLTDVISTTDQLALKKDGTIFQWSLGVPPYWSLPPFTASNVVAIASGDQLLALQENGHVLAGPPGWGFPPPIDLPEVHEIAAGDYFNVALINPSKPLVPPQILASPRSQTVGVNSRVILSVRANGYGRLSYQWYFNETNLISGAVTSFLRLDHLQLSQGGELHCSCKQQRRQFSERTGVRECPAFPGRSVGTGHQRWRSDWKHLST